MEGEERIGCVQELIAGRRLHASNKQSFDLLTISEGWGKRALTIGRICST